MKIQAALLQAPNTPFLVTTLELDGPQPDEVLVKMVAAGVCHSDWHLATGTTKHPLPLVAGHEGAGIVEAAGTNVTHVQPGDHVVLSWTPDCGECFYCQRGQPNLCETWTEPIWAGTLLDGTTRLHYNGAPVYHFCGLATFAEYATVPKESCIPIRKDAPLDVVSLIGCAVATGVGAVMYTAEVKPGDSVVVFGCGGVGLNMIQGAAISGATTIIAVDTNEPKLTIARDLDATHALLSDDNTIDEIRKLTGGRGADHVFEAVGLPAVQELALEAVRPGGKLILAGLAPMGSGTNLPGAILTRQEKMVKGSYYGSVNPHRDFPLLLNMYMSGKLKLDQMISQRYRLDQINEAYAAMLTGEVARGLIVFDD